MDARKINISVFHKAVNKFNLLLSPTMILHKFMVQSPECSKFRRLEMIIALYHGEQKFPRPAKLENIHPCLGSTLWAIEDAHRKTTLVEQGCEIETSEYFRKLQSLLVRDPWLQCHCGRRPYSD